MFLVVDLFPGRLSCKFHGYVVVHVSCFEQVPWRNDWSQHWKSVEEYCVYFLLLFLFWILFQAGHKL
jgi:hypothetical protein